MHDVQWYYKNKLATCAGVCHFFIKTLNLINKKYSAFGLCYTWPSRFSNKDGLDYGKTTDIFITKIPVYFDNDKIWFVDFRNLDMSNFSIYGPFESLQKLDDNFYPLAKRLVFRVNPDVEVKKGVSIIDVRVADDPRIWEAVKFFGVDNYDYYYKELDRKLE